MPSSQAPKRILARQPILTVDKKSYAYQILSRYGPENYCRPSTNSTIHVSAVDELFLRGITTMTEGLPAFINYTATLFGERLADVAATGPGGGGNPGNRSARPGGYGRMPALKSQGYVFALDDYCDSSESRAFLDCADFVKIDVFTTGFEEQQRVVSLSYQRDIPVIAEKVGTDERF